MFGIIVWQKAMDLVEAVYRVFPKEEVYGLTAQLRRGGCESSFTTFQSLMVHFGSWKPSD